MKVAGLFLALGILPSAVWADTAQTFPLLTTLLPSNETPPTTVNASANAAILVHVIRDSSGNIASGSVEFNISAAFPGAATVTGLHIHKGAVGVAGPIVIPTDVRSDAVDSAGKIVYSKLVLFPGAGATEPTLATITDLITNPGNFYVNLHTTDNPGGAIRGQLLKATETVLIGLQSPANETPPITTVTSSGVSTVTVLRALDSSGQVAVANVIFDLQYTGFAANTVFTGFHIHKGPAGVAGPVTINTGIGGAAAVPADSSGAGNLNYTVVVRPTDPSFTAEADTINGLFTNPNGFYINTHTTVNGGGEIRSQLHTTDASTLQVTLSPANETPPITGLAADAVTAVTIRTARNADGTIAAANVNFNVNYRNFPAGTTFTGLHIHQGLAGVAGPIVLPTSIGGINAVTTDVGTGNLHRAVTVSPTFPSTTALTALNNLVKDPSGFYENMHTTVNAGGAVRSQLVATALGKPNIGGIAATSSPITSAAPGSIISLYGTNLSGFTSDLNGFFQLQTLATSLNGDSVTVAGAKAPIYFVSPGQINVQVPFEVTAGSQPVVVTNAGGTANATVTVANAAPSIFVLDTGTSLGAIIKNSDFSVITSANPAKAGDTILIYSTGLGQTTPALQTGSLQLPATGTFNNTADVTVTIGGQPAKIVYSIASPGFPGLYQTAVTVPSGVTGSAPVILKVGSASSNTVNIATQ